MVIFGKLEAVPIRDGWFREDIDFTPWLAKEENLALLGLEMGIALELVEMESRVGSYRCDILAKRAGTNETVVIENQYGGTDHSHLGQLLTYAAGLGTDGSGAKTVVWIAEQFSEPHRAALDWLNQSTEPGIRFFGVELQLWRIGQSAFAPKFSVVSRPNIWQKELTQQTSVISETDQLYRDFWAYFIEFCGEGSALDLPADPPQQHWLGTYVGKSRFSVNLTVSKKMKKLECQLWIDGSRAKAYYAKLLKQKDAIAVALGANTQFDEMATKKPCKIFETVNGDVANRENWPAICEWLKERGETYSRLFRPHLEQWTA